MKKEYADLDVAVIMFDNDDIITTSGGILGNEVGSLPLDDLVFSDIFS